MALHRQNAELQLVAARDLSGRWYLTLTSLLLPHSYVGFHLSIS
jgi:hypothetical protein